MKKRLVQVLSATVIAIALTGGGVAQAKPAPPPKTTTTEVRGSYVTDVGCVPRAVTPHAGDPTKFDGSCYFGSTYTGGLVGHTAGHMTVTVDAISGNMSGKFDEWFYGTYTGDSGSYGGVHYAGSFFIDGQTSTLWGTGKILGGTCSFADSKGSLRFDGMDVYGGFVWQLTRPNPAPVPAPTCNPIDPVPFPVP